MKKFLRKLLKYLAYTGAAIVILLAVAVGLFRLMLPRAPSYQEQIKDWANAAIGMEVEFSGMDARWRLSGPELSFYNARLVAKDGATVLNAEEVSVGVGLLRLLLDLELMADRVAIRDAQVGLTEQADGRWRIQGVSLDDVLQSTEKSRGGTGPLLVVGEDIRVDVRLAHRADPVAIDIEALQFRRDKAQLGFDASLDLPDRFGTRLDIAASRRLADQATLNPWKFYVESRALNLVELSRLWPQDWPRLASGKSDFNLWLDVAPGGILSATANFAASGLALENADAPSGSGTAEAPVGARGRIEYSKGVDDWLLAVDEFVLTTAEGPWPESSLEVRVTSQPSGALDALDLHASYFDLDDLRYIAPLIPEDLRAVYRDLAVTGLLRDVDVQLARPNARIERFNVSAELDRAGVAAYDGWPGVRGFSGRIRADQAGGRLELGATDMQLDLAEHFAAPIEVAEATGTVVWRRSNEGTTILSDSVHLRTADLDSRSSLQITLPSGDASPIVDLQSQWSLENVATVERYLPLKVIKPGLYRWLDNALVSGHVAQGSARFIGPVDRFPFEDGSGTLRIDAHVDNAILRYAEGWPDINNISLDLVIENTHLYSFQNAATSLGNRSVDVRMEIPDVRAPILHIGANATGTLASIHDFVSRSPIANLFGGHLDKIEADGDASFRLDLTLPVLDRENYEFTTTIESAGGTLRIAGLPAPITEVDGKVTITRDTVDSEELTGRFLGDPVSFDLREAGPDRPSQSVVAIAEGTVGAAGLVNGLGLPLAELLSGHTAYVTTIRFPKAGADDPVPLTIAIDSDLEGMALEMPEPLGKTADSAEDLSMTIAFPRQGSIESAGRFAQNVRWDVSLAHGNAGWDFDRGVLALGGDAPGEPETRGLHIEGRTPVVDFDEWLDLASAGGDGPGIGERIRSVDLQVDDLYVIGQHLGRHRVSVNRSAFDWAVQLDGEDAVGSITIPYDFASGRPLVLDMQKLTLPGSDEEKAGGTKLGDPRKLPRLSVHAQEFLLGERHFGRFDAEFLRTEAGLEASDIKTESATFRINGSAGWIVDESNRTGQRSYVSARLASTDARDTMQQLGYQPGIESEHMNVEFDVSWSGGPRQDFLETLDGTVGVRLGSGQLNEVDPGAGRVFGLMSIVALPRRLSLDFSDVFERGFGFDQITGHFRLEDGDAYTCDLSLKGPAADVGIVGRTGLLAKTYEQTAVVSANVGNTLPVVGAVVAGPQVAAALLIFSQIFKKPLQEMGQVYYGIEGSWEDPVVDGVGAQQFARTSAIAGCLEGDE